MAKPKPVAESGGAAARPAQARARDRIFAVAKDLFYRQGIRAVGVETIVSAAGATKMSLYRSFPSKDDLIVAYLRERDAQYWRWWDEIVARHPNAPRAQIRAIFEAIAKGTARPGYRGCPFTNAVTEFPEPDHPGRAVAAENKRELRKRLGALSEALTARDPACLADQLFLLIEGAYATGPLMGSLGPTRSLADAADALIAAHLA